MICNAADAVYRKIWDINIRTIKQIPTAHRNGSKKFKARSTTRTRKNKNILEVAKYLEENDDEQTTVIISKWKPF